MRRSIMAMLALGFGASPAAAADNAAIFSARPAAFRAQLSPQAKSIAYLGAYGSGGRAVMVADLTTGKTTVLLGTPDLTIAPLWCAYKTEVRLVCKLYGTIGLGKMTRNYTRIAAINIDGTGLKVLGQSRGGRAGESVSGGEVIDWLPDDPDHILMEVEVVEGDTTDTNIRAPKPGTGAARMNVSTGVKRMVERSELIVNTLRTDGRGNVRLRSIVDRDPTGYLRDAISYSVRAKGSDAWQPLAKAILSDERRAYFDGFDDTGDFVFKVDQIDGRYALFRVATDGSGARTLVFAHPRFDVDGVQRIGKFNRAVGATFTADRNMVSYFDPKLDRLTKSLSKALPGNPLISIEDESWDGTKLLVHADTDNTPGRYYLYDTATKKLAELVAQRPALDGIALGQVRAVSYAVRDGTTIPAYLTLPPGKTSAAGLPGLLMPHGGPSARDTVGFDWLAQFFAAQGYAVLQPNFRGSTGYGADFFGKNGFQAWATAIGDINDGARWLTTQGVAPGKLAIFGWSYGGYAALQANVVEPQLYRATVAVAPVTDLNQLRTDALEYTNYKLLDRMIGQGPHVAAGSPARHAAKFERPVLIFHADRDLNVDVRQGRIMANALKGAGKTVEFVEYKDLDHQIDDSDKRRDMLSRSAEWFAAAMR